ncbi:MAG TPA: copper homeostasis membrane protein CopD [Caulobacteraceae bacterium]|nr:copper homeostasis membrane protein CopD [Caulobacteraceae bacterium]
MLEVAFINSRLVQYLAAMILCGSPLFFLYGLPRQGSEAATRLGWARPLLAVASAALLVGAVVGLAAQTANVTGEPADALRPRAWLSVVTGADFGPAMAARIVLPIAALALVQLGRPSVPLWGASSLIGGAALASFAWTGHGASDEGMAGLVHLGADVLHLFAAGVWLGALAVLAILLRTSGGGSDLAGLQALHRGLKGFSGVGTATVAILLATGLLNSWFLIGPNHVRDLFVTPYGLLLCGKIAIFVVMLCLAGLNRFRLTPALAGSLSDGGSPAAVRRLRLSIAFETACGGAVLALVAVLGTLEPPSAMG